MAVEGIEAQLGRGAAGETVPVPILLHRSERRAVIGLEHHQVIGTRLQDPADNRRLATPGDLLLMKLDTGFIHMERPMDNPKSNPDRH